MRKRKEISWRRLVHRYIYRNYPIPCVSNPLAFRYQDGDRSDELWNALKKAVNP